MVWRSCLLLGYVFGALSLCVPAIEVLGGPMCGYECWLFSILSQLDAAWYFYDAVRFCIDNGWEKFRFGIGEVFVLLAGWANVWLTVAWMGVFAKSRLVRLGLALGLYAGFGTALVIGFVDVDEEIYIGFYLWCAAFGLAATGMLLSAWPAIDQNNKSRRTC